VHYRRGWSDKNKTSAYTFARLVIEMLVSINESRTPKTRQAAGLQIVPKLNAAFEARQKLGYASELHLIEPLFHRASARILELTGVRTAVGNEPNWGAWFGDCSMSPSQCLCSLRCGTWGSTKR
jgi:hypothetical protein